MRRGRKPKPEPQELSRLWAPEDVPGVRAQQVAFTVQTFAPHAHDTFSLCAFDAGAQVLGYRGRTVLGAAGTLVPINPGEPHSGSAADPAQGWSCRVLHVAPHLLEQAAAQLGAPPASTPLFEPAALADPLLMRRFGAAFEALSRAEASALEREAEVLALLGALLQRHARLRERPTRRSACPAGVRRARALLEARVEQGVSLGELAQVARLSPWHLLRAFRQQLGQTPQVYLRSLRLRRAQQLLGTEMSMGEVALACGYVDQSHLIKQFTRAVGYTPGRYRAVTHAAR